MILIAVTDVISIGSSDVVSENNLWRRAEMEDMEAAVAVDLVEIS